jgi:CPA2 family monovalent cation:H+ antiporter-2
MEAPLDLASFKEALIVLAAAGVVVPLFHRLRVRPVLGFMLVGLVVGPFGVGALAARLPWLSAVTIADSEAIEPIAELGVVLLLFMIGLELSFERLWLMRRLVFGLGTLQVVVSAAALAGAGMLLGLDMTVAVVIGLAWAMSSTAVVIQVLSEERRLTTPVGRASFAILLFQDLAVIPVMFALSALAPSTVGGGTSWSGFGLVVGQAVLAVAAIFALGRLALRPLFRSVARIHRPEFFMAACLLVVIGTALATAAAGLSMALGALIGGLLLAGTEYRRQVEVTIEPFKGLLVGVFLISIGMSLDLRVVAANPGVILGAACGLVLLKLAVVSVLARGFGLSWGTGLQTGLLLGPAGEFGFIILAVAATQHLVPRGIEDQTLIVVALTMASIPLLSALGKRIASRVSPPAPVDSALLVPVGHGTAASVIVAGFGRVGQTVAAMLVAHDVPYIAIDREVDRVTEQRTRGKPVFYGDITRVEILRLLDLDTARALVVTLDDRRAVDQVVAAARAERPDLLIIARARDAPHAAHLYRTGVSEAVPETIEASLQLSEAVLVDIGCPMGPVIASIHAKRAEVQARIRAMAPEIEIRQRGGRRLRDVTLDDDTEEADAVQG